MAVTTIHERKGAEAERRRKAADRAVTMLRKFARTHGGRFVVFGSYVTGTMRFDSDLDVLLGSPLATSVQARQYAEEIGTTYIIAIDLHEACSSKPTFVERVRNAGLVLE